MGQPDPDYEKPEGLQLVISSVITREQDSSLAPLVSVESFKRPRYCDTDDAEDADFQRRKRAFAESSERPKEEP